MVANYEKILLLGSAASGKTNLATKYVSDAFNPEYLQTFGAELFEKSSTDAKKLSLGMWVVGGHERYRTLVTQFYSGVSVWFKLI
jgi:GTPase SAR1 family protein